MRKGIQARVDQVAAACRSLQQPFSKSEAVPGVPHLLARLYMFQFGILTPR
jgi:hypothetical protein